MSKFFTYEDRLSLQKKLKESISIKAIAGDLDKNPTTISGEIKRYSSEVATGHLGYPFNECKNRFNCRNKNICGKDCSRKATQYCKLCPYCNEHCKEFVREICTARFRSPYVCNGCEKVGKCSLLKTIYNYIDACLFDVRNIDLPRKVKFRERYKKSEFKVDKGCSIGRNYQEYLKFKRFL